MYATISNKEGAASTFIDVNIWLYVDLGSASDVSLSFSFPLAIDIKLNSTICAVQCPWK